MSNKCTNLMTIDLSNNESVSFFRAFKRMGYHGTDECLHSHVKDECLKAWGVYHNVSKDDMEISLDRPNKVVRIKFDTPNNPPTKWLTSKNRNPSVKMTCAGWDNGNDYGYVYNGGSLTEYDLEDNNDALQNIDDYSGLVSADIDMMLEELGDGSVEYDTELSLLENLKIITTAYLEK